MGTTIERFEHYVSLIAQQLGHADRVESFRGSCTGLLLPVQRKSVEPMAAHLAPTRVRSEHQRLHHFVADAAWSDDAVLGAVGDYVLEHVVRRAGAPEALCIAAYAVLLAQRIAAPKKPCLIRFSAKCLSYPKASGPAAPLRRQRHVPDSIATLRLELAAALIARLGRCPCCGRPAG